VSVQEARAEPGLGLIGDHRSLRLRRTDAQRHRELSLIQAEHLSLIGAWTGQAPIAPERLRRNLVISGINVAAMHSLFRQPFTYFSQNWAGGTGFQRQHRGTVRNKECR
jgi:MOSC domain-containing protein YiiM